MCLFNPQDLYSHAKTDQKGTPSVLGITPKYSVSVSHAAPDAHGGTDDLTLAEAAEL